MPIQIKRRTSGEGFFEVFSDLIFGMMAVFVLLFIVLITMLRPPPPDVEVPEDIDLVVAIDVSGSMGEQIADLKKALDELGKNFPRIIDGFRVGVIAYRNESFPNGYQNAVAFPLTAMTAETTVNLTNFLDTYVQSIGGNVDPVFATYSALSLFDAALDRKRRTQVFVIIGDADPEYRVNGASETAAITDVSRLISSFANRDEVNRVLALYSGADPVGPDQEFFCSIARAAGSQGRFAAGSELLVWELLEELWKGAQEAPKRDREENEIPC